MAFLTVLSVWMVPIFIFAVPLYAYYRGIPVYDEFIEGAREGLTLTWHILPYLIAMLAAIKVFTNGNGMELLALLFRPIGDAFGIPEEVLPLAMLRPLSGSGSLGVTASIIQDNGPDSFIGRLASVMQGSTETTFYVLTVYFGAVGIKRFRHALWVGLIGDAVAFLAAFLITGFYFL